MPSQETISSQLSENTSHCGMGDRRGNSVQSLVVCRAFFNPDLNIANLIGRGNLRLEEMVVLLLTDDKLYNAALAVQIYPSAVLRSFTFDRAGRQVKQTFDHRKFGMLLPKFGAFIGIHQFRVYIVVFFSISCKFYDLLHRTECKEVDLHRQ